MTVKPVGKGKYVLVSKKGKALTKPVSKKEAIHREKQVVFFKNDAKYFKDHGRHIPIKKKKK